MGPQTCKPTMDAMPSLERRYAYYMKQKQIKFECLLYLIILVQAEQIYCTISSTSHHRLLLKIFHFTQIQTTTVLLLLIVIGGCHGARMNTVLSVSQVSDHYLFCISNITFCTKNHKFYNQRLLASNVLCVTWVSNLT